MKVIAGIALAGAIAAGVAVVGGGLGPLGAAAPVERKDPAPGQAYRIEPVPLNATSMGYAVDDAGRLCSVKSRTATIWRYDPEKRQSTLLAGSTFGSMDGPLDRARFGGWAYNQPSRMQLSSDGRRVFVKERNGNWRLIDLKAGVVTTLFPYQEKNGAHNIVARDKSGDMYVFKTSGETPPDAPGCKKLKVAKFKNGKTGHYIGYMSGYALDVERMRFYWHARGDVKYCDLKTGVIINLNPGPKRRGGTTGDIKSWKPWCPAGMSISPTGRYLYVGGGDDLTCWRFDLEKNRCTAFGWDPATRTISFRDGGTDGKGWRPNFPAADNFWPNVTVFAPDGSGYWSARGCMRLVPVK